MEGFLKFKLPVWKRVMLTRAIAIVPAMLVVFFQTETLTGLDTILNITQSIQLPFALVPTIKFACDKKIMGDFAIPLWQTIFATILGLGLFFMNFVLIFEDGIFSHWYEYVAVSLFVILYMTLIGIAIFTPTKKLKPLT